MKENDAYKAHIDGFKKLRQEYSRLAPIIQSALEGICANLELHPVVGVRVKTLESFAEKIRRPGKSYRDPLAEVTDFCGGRIIVHTLDDVDTLDRFIRGRFSIDFSNSEDKAEKLRYGEFGYLSRHFIVQLDDRWLPFIANEKDKAEFARVAVRNAEGRVFVLELQLRTLAQHVWADIYHELGYKNEFKLADRWNRDFARVSALLELADKEFGRVKREIESIGTDYGAYLDADGIADMLERQKSLFELLPDNPDIARKLLKLYVSSGAWSQASEFYRENAALISASSAALRDAGLAVSRAGVSGGEAEGVRRGKDILSESISLARANGDARNLCESCACLGGILFKEGDIESARNYYREAHDASPGNPYPLGNYISCELLLNRDTSVLGHFRYAIGEAENICRRQIEVKANIPWAFYDLSCFALFRGDTDSAFALMLAGAIRSLDSWMIRSAQSRPASWMEKGIALYGLEEYLRAVSLAADFREGGKKKEKDGSSTADRVLIVAGDCDEEHLVSPDVSEALLAALGSFRGIVVSGGTRSGVSRIVGEAQARNPSITSIGYLPGAAASLHGGDVVPDDRYTTLVRTDGTSFSIREALRYWRDLKEKGIGIGQVRMIGIGGGPISGLEYRLALACGARVGLVDGSGSAARAFLDDSFLGEAAGSEALDGSRESLERFVNG